MPRRFECVRKHPDPSSILCVLTLAKCSDFNYAGLVSAFRLRPSGNLHFIQSVAKLASVVYAVIVMHSWRLAARSAYFSGAHFARRRPRRRSLLSIGGIVMHRRRISIDRLGGHGTF